MYSVKIFFIFLFVFYLFPYSCEKRYIKPFLHKLLYNIYPNEKEDIEITLDLEHMESEQSVDYISEVCPFEQGTIEILIEA